ncbi:MAG: cytochrome c [Anaerolineales bacterium]|nr:cytochrome c [Anaerolineales bacterium]
MADQPLHSPLEPGAFFADGQAARPLPAHTLPREAPASAALHTGFAAGDPLPQNPLPLTAGLLTRGQQQYDIFCTPCHGLLGDGQGMIVQRGFPQPPSFHSQRLRQLPDGAIFDVITNGYGRMFAYGARVKPADRWAIVAYVRALQLSQQADAAQLPPADRQQLSLPEAQP